MSFIDVIQGRATLDITPFQNSLKQLQSQVNGVTTSINQGLTGVGTGAQKASSGLSALEERLNAVYRAGTQMMHVGTSFLMLGGAIQGLLVGAVEAGQAFDFWERKTEAVTEQLNAQGQVVQFATNQHNLFRQAIEGVTESVGALNPDEVAHSFYLWTSATNTTVDSLDKLNQVSGQVDVIMKAATMSGATAQQVIRGVANSMSEFGLDTDKTAYVTSVLMNVTHMTEAEMTDLIQSFKMVGPEAKVMGESLGDVAAILGVMADMGIKGTQAGRGLQRMLDGFIKPSASADSMLQGLLITNRGLQGSWRDMLYPGGQFVGLLDSTNAQGQKVDGVLHQLYEGMQKLTPEQQLLAMHTMQTENGFRELLPLLEAYTKSVQSGGDVTKGFIPDIEKFSTMLGDESKMVQLFNDKWAQVSQTIKVQFGSQLNQLKFALYDLGVAAEAAFLPILKTINSLLDGLRNWAQQNSSLFQSIVQGIAIFSAFALAIGAGLFVLGKAVQAVTAFRLVIEGIATVLSAVEMSFLPIIAVIGAVVIAVIAFNKAMESNSQLGRDLTTLAAAFKDAFGSIINIVGLAVQFINDIMTGNLQGAFNVAIQIAANFVAGFGNAFSKLGSLVKAILLQLLANFDAAFGGLGTAMLRWGQNVMAAFASGMIQAINAYVVPAINAVISMISNFLEGHSPPKDGPLKNIDTWGANVMQAYLNGFTKADFTVLADASKMIQDHLTEEVKNGNMGAGAAYSLWEGARSKLAQIIELQKQGKQVGADMWDSLSSAIGPYASDIETVIQKTLGLAAAEKQVQDIKNQIAADQAALVDPQLQIDTNQNTIDQLNYQKDSLNVQKQQIEAGKEQYQNNIDNLNATKDGLQAQKDAEQTVLDGLHEQTQAINDAKQAIQDKIDALNQEKSAIQEQINAIQRKYDLEHQAQTEYLANLKAQLDLSKAIQDQALLPLTDKANDAQQTLNDIKDKNKLSEEPLQLQIDQLKASGRGTSDPQVKYLEAKLAAMKAQNAVAEEQAQIAYDLAEHQLKVAQQEAALKTKTTQDQYNVLNAQALVDQAQQKLAHTTQIDTLKAQQAAIDDQTLALKHQQDAYKQQELNIRNETAVEDKKMKNLDGQMRAIDLQIKAQTQQEKLIDAQARVYDNQIKALDNQIAALNHANAGIKVQQMDPLSLQIKQLQAQLTGKGGPDQQQKDAQNALDAAKARLAFDMEADTFAKALDSAMKSANSGNKKAAGPSAFDKMMGIGGGGLTGVPALAGINKPSTPGDLSPEEMAAAVRKALGLDDNGNIVKSLNPFSAVSDAFGQRVSNAQTQISSFAGQAGGFGAGFLNSLGFNVGTPQAPVLPTRRGRMGGSTEEQAAAEQRYQDDLNRYHQLVASQNQGLAQGGKAGAFSQQNNQSNLPAISAMMSLFGLAMPGARLPSLPGGLTSLLGRAGGLGGRLLGAGAGVGDDAMAALTARLTASGGLLGEGGFVGKLSSLLGSGITKLPGAALREASLWSTFASGGRLAGPVGAPLAVASRVADATMQGAGAIGGGIATVGGDMTGLFGLNKLPVAVLGEFLTKIKDLALIFPAVGKSAGTVSDAFGILGKIFGTARTILAPFAGILETVLGVFLKFPIIGGILKAVPIVGWVLTIIQVIQLLKTGWDTNWNGMRDQLTTFWTAAQIIFKHIAAIMGDKDLDFSTKLGAIVQQLGHLAEALGSAIGPVIQKALAQLGKNLPGWIQQAGQLFADLLGGLVNFLLTNAIPFALNLVAGLIHVIAAFFQHLDSAVTSDGGMQGAGSSSFGKWFGTMFQRLVGYVGDHYQEWGAALIPALVNLFKALMELVGSIIHLDLDLFLWFAGMMASLIGFIMSHVGEYAHGIFLHFLGIWNGAMDFLFKDGGPVIRLYTWIGNAIYQPFLDYLGNQVSTWAGELKAWFLNWWNQTITFLTGDGNPLQALNNWMTTNIIGQFVLYITNMISTWATTIFQFFKDLWAAFMRFINNAQHDFWGALLTFIQDVFKAFLKATQGYLDGWWPGLGTAISTAFTNAINAAKAALVAPFKGLTDWLGQQLDAAIALKNKILGMAGGSAPSGGGVAGDGVTYEGEVAAGRTTLTKAEWEPAHKADVAAAGHNAAGTDFWRGGLSWVGEKGMELLNLPMGTQVLPMKKVYQGISGGLRDMLYSVGSRSADTSGNAIASSLSQVASAIQTLARSKQQTSVSQPTIHVDNMNLQNQNDINHWINQAQYMGNS